MRTYNVTARKWKHGWELDIAGEGVTQSRSLASAEQQVRDYLDTVHGDHRSDDARVEITHALDAVVATVLHERTVRDKIAVEAAEAARESERRAAASLRDSGLSIADTAAVLGVSKGWAQQLSRPN